MRVKRAVGTDQRVSRLLELKLVRGVTKELELLLSTPEEGMREDIL